MTSKTQTIPTSSAVEPQAEPPIRKSFHALMDLILAVGSRNPELDQVYEAICAALPAFVDEKLAALEEEHAAHAADLAVQVAERRARGLAGEAEADEAHRALIARWAAWLDESGRERIARWTPSGEAPELADGVWLALDSDRFIVGHGDTPAEARRSANAGVLEFLSSPERAAHVFDDEPSDAWLDSMVYEIGSASEQLSLLFIRGERPGLAKQLGEQLCR